ncbi:hypothetical protein [Pseudogemmobacter humi]|uniref:Uncharacterized protein n=1 Tax=Pseudogemmobacter humi TaxID=2483812 RepID=A0A3P5XRN4_9RHOB|nr:hypothetical protein [Pseudogemmobacter humi]VDC31543.1 hypothetical protein XINFAN_02943 [Pseudogemmobacter humi]
MPDTPHGLLAIIQAVWAQLLALVALIVWLVRGEARTKANAAEIRRLWRQREEDLRAHKEARDTTNAMLDEVRRDIKTLLARRD